MAGAQTAYCAHRFPFWGSPSLRPGRYADLLPVVGIASPSGEALH